MDRDTDGPRRGLLEHDGFGLVLLGRAFVALCLCLGVFVGIVGVLGATPAQAAGTTWYAYPSGTSTSTSSCPLSSLTGSQCSLTQALANAAAGDTVALATSGVEETASTYYVGNFTVSTPGTSPTSQVTVEPASMVTDPILDGDGSAFEDCPTGPS